MPSTSTAARPAKTKKHKKNQPVNRTRSAPLNMRATPELRERLENEAARYRRPMTQLAEMILQRHFDENALPETLETFIQSGRQILAQIIKSTGNDPHKDVSSYLMARAALKEWLEYLPSPKGADFPELQAVEHAEIKLAAITQRISDEFQKYSPATKTTEETKDNAALSGIQLKEGLGELLRFESDIPPQDNRKDSEFLQDYLKEVRKRNDAKTEEQLLNLIPLMQEKEAAEEKLEQARKKLFAKVESLENKGKQSVKMRLASVSKSPGK